MDGFEIWQKDATGKRIPAVDREVYYPVFQVTPQKGNHKAVGFDLGSESTRRAAIETALRTGLTTASDSVTLVQETSSQKGMLVFRPIFTDTECRTPRGFALAVLRLGDVLATTRPDATVSEELLLAQSGNPLESLACSWMLDNPPSRMFAMNQPVLAFGKTFIVAAHAGPEFLRMHPTRSGVALAGLLLTTALAIVISMLLRRRQALENLVRERTTALRQSNARFNQLAEQSRTIAWELNAGGLYTYASHVIELVLGYRSEELVGKMHFYDLHPETGREEFKRAAFEVFDRKEPFVNLESAALTKNGRTVWLSTNGIPMLNVDGTLRGYRGSDTDITERRRAEEELRESEAFQRELLLSLPAGVVIVDPATLQIEQLNEYTATLFGAPTDRLQGKHCHALAVSR